MMTIVLVTVSIFFAGCSSEGMLGSSAANTGGLGALVGAGAGAIIGNQSGNTGMGALIGGAAGGVGGYIVGNEKDKKEAKQQQQVAVAPNGQGAMVYNHQQSETLQYDPATGTYKKVGGTYTVTGSGQSTSATPIVNAPAVPTSPTQVPATVVTQ